MFFVAIFKCTQWHGRVVDNQKVETAIKTTPEINSIKPGYTDCRKLNMFLGQNRHSSYAHLRHSTNCVLK